jgi:hypothetical protein
MGILLVGGRGLRFLIRCDVVRRDNSAMYAKILLCYFVYCITPVSSACLFDTLDSSPPWRYVSTYTITLHEFSSSMRLSGHWHLFPPTSDRINRPSAITHRVIHDVLVDCLQAPPDTDTRSRSQYYSSFHAVRRQQLGLGLGDDRTWNCHHFWRWAMVWKGRGVGVVVIDGSFDN